jgi:hypothetical protein
MRTIYGTAWAVPGRGASLGDLKRALGVPAQLVDFKLASNLNLTGLPCDDPLDQRRLADEIERMESGAAVGGAGRTESDAGEASGPAAPLSILKRHERRRKLMRALERVWAGFDNDRESEVSLMQALRRIGDAPLMESDDYVLQRLTELEVGL